jgi:hypothetical protein
MSNRDSWPDKPFGEGETVGTTGAGWKTGAVDHAGSVVLRRCVAPRVGTITSGALFAGEAPGAPDVLVLGDALGAGVDVLLCARSDGLETLAVLGVLGTAPSAGNADDEDAGPCLTGVVVAALWPLPGTVLQVDAL